MNKNELSNFLKSIGHSQAAVNRSLRAFDAFENWLEAEQSLTIDDDISEEILENFLLYAKKGQKNLLLGLAGVFEFQGKENLKTATMQMRRAILDKEIKPMRLKDFLGVDQDLVKALKENGMRNAYQLLQSCRTVQDRKTLADEFGVSYKTLLDLVKMADLSRIFAVKAVRTRLYLDSGNDTLDKLAAQDPMTLHLDLVKFVDESHFDGIPTTPKEASFTVKEAQKIERWITFENDE